MIYLNAPFYLVENAADGIFPLLYSYLALSGSNGNLNTYRPETVLEDGILNANELLNINFYDTSLAVLAACNPGNGIRLLKQEKLKQSDTVHRFPSLFP